MVPEVVLFLVHCVKSLYDKVDSGTVCYQGLFVFWVGFCVLKTHAHKENCEKLLKMGSAESNGTVATLQMLS